MDGSALLNDRIGTLSGFGAGPLAAADGCSGLGETTRGAATAQIARTSVASVTKPARAKNISRLPQANFIVLILPRKRSRDYSSLEGGQRS
jgi:hypothetical protein